MGPPEAECEAPSAASQRGSVRVGVPPGPPSSSAWREQIRQPSSKRPHGGANPPVETFKEGELARCGHPFEAGGATETSLGIKTSAFRILEREPSEARHVLETRWVGRPPAVEHDHLSPPILEGEPGTARAPPRKRTDRPSPVVMRVHRRCSPRRPLRGHPRDSPLPLVGAAPSPRCRAPSATLSLARSSKAEPPPDKRQTPEHYRSGQPFWRANPRSEETRC